MRYGGHAKPRGGWLVPLLVWLVGFMPILALLGDGGRSISTFPASLPPGWIAWTTSGGLLTLLAFPAPFLMAFLAWKARELLVRPWPAVLVCMLLSPLPFVGTLAFERAGGEAIYPDRVAFRDATPWSKPEAAPYSRVVLIEKGCSFRRRGRGASGIYSLVFADGRRVALGSDPRPYRLSRLGHLDLVQRIDALPALRDTDRQVRRVAGGEVNNRRCIAELASYYPAHRQDDVFRLFSPCGPLPPGADAPDKTTGAGPATSPGCERGKARSAA